MKNNFEITQQQVAFLQANTNDSDFQNTTESIFSPNFQGAKVRRAIFSPNFSMWAKNFSSTWLLFVQKIIYVAAVKVCDIHVHILFRDILQPTERGIKIKSHKDWCMTCAGDASPLHYLPVESLIPKVVILGKSMF